MPFLSDRLQQLKWIRQYFHNVCCMTKCMNEMFGWSHIAAILFCYYFLLTDLTWCYTSCIDISLREQIGNHGIIILIDSFFQFETDNVSFQAWAFG